MNILKKLLKLLRFLILIACLAAVIYVVRKEVYFFEKSIFLNSGIFSARTGNYQLILNVIENKKIEAVVQDFKTDDLFTYAGSDVYREYPSSGTLKLLGQNQKFSINFEEVGDRLMTGMLFANEQPVGNLVFKPVIQQQAVPENQKQKYNQEALDLLKNLRSDLLQISDSLHLVNKKRRKLIQKIDQLQEILNLDPASELVQAKVKEVIQEEEQVSQRIKEEVLELKHLSGRNQRLVNLLSEQKFHELNEDLLNMESRIINMSEDENKNVLTSPDDYLLYDDIQVKQLKQDIAAEKDMIYLIKYRLAEVNDE